MAGIKVAIKSALFFLVYLLIFKLIGFEILWPALVLAIHMAYGLIYKVYFQRVRPWQPYLWCLD